MSQQAVIQQDSLPMFDDGKAPDALRTIGEVSKGLDIRQHVLRYWEEHFPMLRPVKRSGGRRYYRPEDIQLLVTIDRLVHHEGYTLRGARQAIESRNHAKETSASDTGARPSGQAEAAERAAVPLPAGTDVRSRLHGIRNTLAEALAKS